jgi:hypothetical protein
MDENRAGGNKRKESWRGAPSTTTNQLESYTTVRNIELEISLEEKLWPKFVLKELQDNAYDWLNEQYSEDKFDEEHRKIDVRI